MQKVYLFGGGNNAYGVIEYIGKENVIAIIDNEPKRQGDFVLDIPIIAFEEYKNKQRGEKVVITAAMYEEIVQQLQENNIFNYTVAPLIIMGLATPKDIADEWNLYDKTSLYIVGYNIVGQKFCEWMLGVNPEIKIYVATDSVVEKKEVIKQELELVSFENIPDIAGVLVFKEELSTEDKKQLENFKNVYDIYSLIPKKNKRYENRLEEFKNSNKNKKCFIVGNGPSLQIEDLETMQRLHIPNFGLNLIYKLYDNTKWRPTYYVITEYNIYRTYYDEIVNLQHGNMFVKNFYCMEGTPYIANVNYYPGYARRSYFDEQKFSDDLTKRIYAGYSVMYDAIQIAAYMGFREIYLIGADFSYLNDPAQKGNHVYDNVATERRKVAGRAYLDATINALYVAKEYAAFHGIKIYNATRGGNLEVFERKNLDEIFTQMKEHEM